MGQIVAAGFQRLVQIKGQLNTGTAIIEGLPLVNELSGIRPEKEAEDQKQPSYQQKYRNLEICPLPQGIPAAEPGRSRP